MKEFSNLLYCLVLMLSAFAYGSGKIVGNEKAYKYGSLTFVLAIFLPEFNRVFGWW